MAEIVKCCGTCKHGSALVGGLIQCNYPCNWDELPDSLLRNDMDAWRQGKRCAVYEARDACAASGSRAMSDKWIAYTDYDQVEAFATEAEAVAWAEGQIDGYLADGTWDEGVESIIVARLTHAIVKTVLGVKAEMTADAWDELTHSNQDADEWWRFDLKPIEEQSHE